MILTGKAGKHYITKTTKKRLQELAEELGKMNLEPKTKKKVKIQGRLLTEPEKVAVVKMGGVYNDDDYYLTFRTYKQRINWFKQVKKAYELQGDVGVEKFLRKIGLQPEGEGEKPVKILTEPNGLIKSIAK